MARRTVAELRSMAAAYIRARDRVMGRRTDGSRLELAEGSELYGNAWGIYETGGPNGTGRHTVLNLTTTRSGAYDRLQAAIGTLHDVLDARGEHLSWDDRKID